MTAPGAGSILQNSRSIRCAKGRSGDEHPVVGQPITATVGAIPNNDGVYRSGGSQVDLPPGVRFQTGGVGDRAIVVVPVSVAVHGLVRRIPGIGAALVGG